MSDKTAASDRSLTTAEVLERLHLRESSRYGWLRRAVRVGKFPPPDAKQQGRGQQNQWRLSTIEAWEQSRTLGSEQPALDFDALEAMEAEALWHRDDVLALVQRTAWTLSRWIDEKRFPEPDVEKLSMVQVAERFHLSISTVRNWEKKGIAVPNRDRGIPMYGAKELRQLYDATVQKDYEKQPPQTAQRFLAGYFWTSETLEEWASSPLLWGKIEQFDRTAVLMRLRVRSR